MMLLLYYVLWQRQKPWHCFFFFHQACCLNQFQKSFVVLIWFAFVVPYFFQLRNNLKIQNVAKVKQTQSLFFSDSSNNPGKESLTFMYTCFLGSINHQHNNKALSMSFYSKTQCHFFFKREKLIHVWYIWIFAPKI